MQGLSERQYAARVGLSRGAIQKAKEAGRLVLHTDGSIDAAAFDQRRAALTDPSKSCAAPPARAAPVTPPHGWSCPLARNTLSARHSNAASRARSVAVRIHDKICRALTGGCSAGTLVKVSARYLQDHNHQGR
jgi:hypothetical protein